MSKHTDQALAKVARLDGDIAALRARLDAKLDERQALLNDLFADGERIRMAISPELVSAPPVAVPASTGRLTEDDVRSMREAFAAGATQTALAHQYGISQPSVNAIVRRRSYKDVA